LVRDSLGLKPWAFRSAMCCLSATARLKAKVLVRSSRFRAETT
jgi:hypothetical protein